MIIQFFKSFLSKKNEAEKPAAPVFNITESVPLKSDFEVTELSYEEYVRIVGQDRRQATTYVSHDRRSGSSSVAA